MQATTEPQPHAEAGSALLDAVVDRAGRPDFERFRAQLRSSGFCARPVRLRGSVAVCDGHGQRQEVWSTDAEPDGVLRKACGNRREAVCGPCAERYRGDAYHLIAAGLRGGKDVPESVLAHPAVFVTLTAPSFGAVHTRPLDANGRARRCRPRRDAPTCPHGTRLSCNQVHDEDDERLGEPICSECFDYDAAVLWNNLLGELWRRTTIYMPRKLAAQCGLTQKRLRECVRFSFAKIAEYQARGLVHIHAVIRLDRAMPAYRATELRPPDTRFTNELLEHAVRDAAQDVCVRAPEELGGDYARWGDQVDVRPLTASERHKVAGYLAKYATKSTEQAGGLLHRISADDIDIAPVREHVRSYLRRAFALHEHAPDRRLAATAHAFGYRGHCLTKSRRYSTTFKALRQAREQYVHGRLLARSDDESQRALAEIDPATRITSFAYVGHGHLTTADAFLAASAAARARDERRAAREALSDEHTWTTRGPMPAPEDAA